MTNEILAILGGLVTFLLSVNGWYFRDIVKNLTEIKITLAKLSESHDNQIQLVDKHDRDLEKIKERLSRLEAHASH